MKIFIKTLIIFGTLLTSLYAAEWKAEGGVGMWNSSTNGAIEHYGNIDLLGVIATDIDITDSMSNQSSMFGYAYVNIQHSISMAPNIGFEYSHVQGLGDITYFEQSLWFGNSITLHSETQLAITQYDTLLFYPVLDNYLGLSLDMGVDIKYMSTQYQVSDLNVDTQSTAWVPMFYLHGRYEVLESGLSLNSDIKYITDGSSTLYDFKAKVHYTLPIEMQLHPGLELGYRVQSFYVKGENSQFLGDLFSGKSDVDVLFDGLYGGLTLQF